MCSLISPQARTRMELGNNNCHARRLSGRMGEYHDTETWTHEQQQQQRALVASRQPTLRRSISTVGWTLLPSNMSGIIVDLHARIHTYLLALDAPDGSKAGQSPADAPPQTPLLAAICHDYSFRQLCVEALLETLCETLPSLVRAGSAAMHARTRVAVSRRPAFRNACEPCFRAGRCTRARGAEQHLARGCRGQ